jgi:hypothetical protein
MIKLPLTPINQALARRIIWFEPPEQALADPIRFLAYAFRYANLNDIVLLQASYDRDTLAHALQNAPPGIIDARSWAYWNLILRDLSPPPPMPTRTFA